MPDIVRNTERKRRDLPQPGHTAVLHNCAAADTEPVSARQAEIAASQLLLHSVLRLRGSVQQSLLQLLLEQDGSDTERTLTPRIQNGRLLPHPQPQLLDLRVRYAGQRNLYRLRKHPQDLISHSLTPQSKSIVRPAPVFHLLDKPSGAL